MAALLTPILNQDLRNPNFFDGRLLTATDLRDEQAAHRSQHGLLGQAIGAGVVHGLQVEKGPISAGAQTVVVRQGLALNAKGQALALKQDIELALTPGQDVAATNAGIFVNCPQPTSDKLAPTSGIYVLAISPASAYAERAPMRDFGDASVSGCGDRYAVEGVQFRQVELNAAAMPDVGKLDQQLDVSFDARALSQLRNLLAHYCFGTLVLNDFAREPFLTSAGQSAFFERGAVDRLVADGKLSGCDVPLAVLYWSQGVLRFVDAWSVRRSTVAPAVDLFWPFLVGERRPAEADATFLQFQDHLERLRAETPRRDLLRARDYFRFLPPAGYLPLGSAGFDVGNFFAELDVVAVLSDPAFARLQVQQARWVDPIDLLPDDTTILLYVNDRQPDYLLFVRAEASRAFVDTQPVDDVPPPAGDRPGRVHVDLIVRDANRTVSAIESVLGRGSAGESEANAAKLLKKRTDGALAAQLDQHTDILIWAESVLKPSSRYPARLLKSGFSKLGSGDKISLRNGTARYVIDSLPPGDYRIKVQITGFQDASQTKTVSSHQTVQATFYLTPRTGKPGGRPMLPKDYLDASWHESGVYGKFVVFDKAIDWPWPPEPALEKWPYQDPRVNPLPAAVEMDLINLAEWAAASYPDAPLNPGDIRLHIAPDHQPNVVSKTPYAYVVFGDGGAYMPVALTFSDRTLARPITIGKANIAGVDRELEEQLATAGVRSVDVLAAVWTDLLGEALGFSDTAAAGVIETAVGKVDVAQEGSLHDSVLLFAGVDAAVAAELAQAGVTTAIELANLTPAELVAALGAGSKVDLAFAQRLVDDARAIVTPSLWSLDSTGLPMDMTSALRDSGIETLAMLNELAQRDPTGTAVREFLPNASDAQIESFRGLVADAKTQHAIGRKAAALLLNARSAAALALSSDEAVELAKSGFSTVGSLAAADLDVQAVSNALGGDAERAAALIASARGSLGL